MRATIYSPTDLTTPLVILPRVTDPKYLDERNRDGGGAFVISTKDPAYLRAVEAEALVEGNLVMISKPGNDSWFEIEAPVGRVIGAEAALTRTVAGKGPMAWLRHAVVFPRVGEPDSGNTRRFNFASPRGDWYVPEQWGARTIVGEANSAGGKGTGWWFGPGKWPLVNRGSWIWDRDASVTAPAGDVYFRYEFNLTGATRTVRLYASARDVAALFIDGVPVASITQFSAYQRTVQVDIELTPGAHIFAAHARKSRSGPAGLLAMLTEVPAAGADLTVPDRIWWTGQTGWEVAGYPAQAPGWTAGQVLKALLGEARARGVTSLQRLTDTFNGGGDSNGVEWADRFGWEFRIGSTYRDVLTEMQAIVSDVWIGSDFTLNAAQKRGVDRTVARGSKPPVIFRPGHNVVSANTTSESDDLVTALLMMTNDGLIQRSAPGPEDPRIGRREAYLSDTSASKNGTAPLLAAQVFEQRAKRRLSPEIDIIAKEGATPYVDFNVGDYVLAPSDDGAALVKRRVVSIAYAEAKDTAEPVWSLEIDSIATTADERMARWIQRTDAGSLSGTVGGSAGVSASLTPQTSVPTTPDPVIPGSQIQTPLAPSSLDGESSAYLDRSGRPLSQVLLTWPEVTRDTAGAEVQVEGYEVWERRPAVSSEWISRGTVAGPAAAMGGYVPGQSWQFRVRTIAARSQNPSAYSPTKTIVMAADNTPPPPPSKPALSSRLGAVTVKWDGRDSSGQPMPPDLDYVTVERRAMTEVEFNYFPQPTVALASVPLRWVRSNIDTVAPYRAPDEQMGTAVALDFRTAGVGAAMETVIPVPSGGWAFVVFVNVRSGVSFRMEATAGTSTFTQTKVQSVTGWQRHTLLFSSSANESVTLRFTQLQVSTDAPARALFGQFAVTNMAISDFWTGDTVSPSGAYEYAWMGDRENSISRRARVVWSAVGQVLRGAGVQSFVDTGLPYNEEVGYRLIAVDTSQNVSQPSEVSAIVVKPLVDTDLIGKIISDANIVDVDGSKIHPSTIETTSLKVGQGNLLVDSKFADPALRAVRVLPSASSFIESGVEGFLLRMAINSTGAVFLGTTTEECSPTAPKPWIDVIASQEYVFTAEMQSVGTAATSLRVRVRYLLANGSTTSVSTVGDIATTAAGVIQTVAIKFNVPYNARRIAIGVVRNDFNSGTDLLLTSVGLRPAIGGVLIQDGAVTAPKIAALAIEAGAIAANAITAGTIAAGAVTATAIAADAITTQKLDAFAITAKHTITSAKYQTTSTPLRGIEITSTGFRAYDSSGQEVVSISATNGNVVIAGTYRTGLDSNQIVISDSIFRGRPGIRFDTGSTAALEPTIQSLGVASSGYPAGTFVITGRETTVNSTGRADLQLDSGGNFALRTQYGQTSGIGVDKTGWDLYLRGKMPGGVNSGFFGGIHQQEMVRTAAIPVGGTQGFTFGTPRPSGTTIAQCTPFTTDGSNQPQFVVNAQDATRVQVALTRSGTNACFGNLTIGWV